MKVIQVKIEDLKPAEYNPRALSKKEAAHLKKSVTKFGMVEPIVVNGAKDRMNIIIGGHQRMNILKKMGETLVPVVYVNIPEIEKERELNLRLNKNVGHWDFDLLANFDEELLKMVGFEEKELEKTFQLGDPVIGEEDFATEMLEEQNYVLFTFDNVVDWNFVKEKLGLKIVKVPGNKSEARGVGRIVSGKILIGLLENAK